MDHTVDMSSILMVDWNVLSILAKSDFEFNGQMEAYEKKSEGEKKEKMGEIRRSSMLITEKFEKIHA